MLASHAISHGCFVVLALFSTAFSSASFVGVHPSECQKYTWKIRSPPLTSKLGQFFLHFLVSTQSHLLLLPQLLPSYCLSLHPSGFSLHVLTSCCCHNPSAAALRKPILCRKHQEKEQSSRLLQGLSRSGMSITPPAFHFHLFIFPLCCKESCVRFFALFPPTPSVLHLLHFPVSSSFSSTRHLSTGVFEDSRVFSLAVCFKGTKVTTLAVFFKGSWVPYPGCFSFLFGSPQRALSLSISVHTSHKFASSSIASRHGRRGKGEGGLDRSDHSASTWPLHFCHHYFQTFC